MQDEQCEACGRDVALGTPLFARRVKLLSDADPGVAFVCIDCRAAQPLLTSWAFTTS